MDTEEEKKYCSEYTGFEMMLVSASRQVKEDDIIFNAFHWPFLVVHMARLLHFPDLYNVIEIGITKDELIKPTKMPYSISDPILVPNSLFIGDSIDVLSILQRGEITLAFLSTSMIDKYGNCNTTVIGPYEKPIYRLPGGGGATEIAGLSKRLIWLLDEHTKRKFRDKLEYITDPGYLEGYDSRVKAGINIDGGLLSSEIDDKIQTPFMFLNSKRYLGYGKLFTSKMLKMTLGGLYARWKREHR